MLKITKPLLLCFVVGRFSLPQNLHIACYLRETKLNYSLAAETAAKMKTDDTCLFSYLNL